MSISQIRLALNAERGAVPEASVFKILSITPSPHGLWLEVQPKNAYGHTPKLDDEMRNAQAWWNAKTKGAALVKQTISQENKMFIGNLKGIAPTVNLDLLVYPEDFIKSLLACWNNDEWATQAFDCLQDLTHPKHIESATLTGHQFKSLRPAQLQALRLVNQSSGYLWGPPGTGKTTTLGAMIADYLHSNPFARVLLVSTTNRAVDEATIAVDNSLERAKLTALRHTIQRVGSWFNPNKYARRQHLLPENLRNITFLRDSSTPDHEPGSEEDEVILAGVVSSSIRLRTMTISHAVRGMEKMKKDAPFDLLVFDEASQISLAQALIVMPLGKARVFAGDPMQLAPITQSPAVTVRLWLKRTVFDFKPSTGPSVCLLNEQSRMAPPICDIISQVFYGGSLRVAQEALDSQHWHQVRKIKFGPIARHKHVHIQTINTEAVRSRESKGLIRYESADWIVQTIFAAVRIDGLPQEEILVVTPFVSQRTLILEALARDGLKNVRVSTIHSEQGGEASVVIFDPVDGCHAMSSGPAGRLLINVGLSRAKAKLILTLSEGDRANPLIAQICAIIDQQADRKPQPIAQVLSDPQYITHAVGQYVDVNGQVGEITQFSRDGAIMWLIVESTDKEITFSTDALRATSMLGDVRVV